VATGRLVHEFEGHTADGVTVFVSHDGRLLVSSGNDGCLRLWDVAKLREIWTQNVSGEQIDRVVFSPDDGLILTSGADPILRIRELTSGKVVERLEGHT
jgi:WD40 repeat protein